MLQNFQDALLINFNSYKFILHRFKQKHQTETQTKQINATRTSIKIWYCTAFC